MNMANLFQQVRPSTKQAFNVASKNWSDSEWIYYLINVYLIFDNIIQLDLRVSS